MCESSATSLRNPVRARAATLFGLAGTALLLTALAVLARPQAHAHGPAAGVQTGVPAARIAVIDVQKVLAQSSAGKSAFEKLKRLQEERLTKAKQMDAEVRQLDAEITAKKASLSETKLAEMQKQLADRRAAMQRYAQDADREIAEARDRELAALEARIKPVIDALGREAGLTAIFNKFESGLIYASESIDITDTVIRRFNQATPAGGQPVAPKP